jgi:hypothetical protein
MPPPWKTLNYLLALSRLQGSSVSLLIASGLIPTAQIAHLAVIHGRLKLAIATPRIWLHAFVTRLSSATRILTAIRLP